MIRKDRIAGETRLERGAPTARNTKGSLSAFAPLNQQQLKRSTRVSPERQRATKQALCGVRGPYRACRRSQGSTQVGRVAPRPPPLRLNPIEVRCQVRQHFRGST